MTGANERITAEATSWPGVSAGYGERGEWGFAVGRKRIGHLHGDRVAPRGLRPLTDAPRSQPPDASRSQWEDLMRSGRVERHPIDRPGWAARRIEGEADVVEVLALLRLNYDRAAAKHGVAA